MDQIQINNYSFDKPLISKNSGFSKWGIGSRGGQTYFVKEFLAPVYPAEEDFFTEDAKQARIQYCQDFVDSKIKLYTAIREAAEGHIVTVEQFFRVGAHFYISTKAITDPLLTIDDIANCPFIDRLRLCCSIAHGMAAIHKKGVIHADIKPNNILVVRKAGLQANIIDFDCSFFAQMSPKLGEELHGDQVYFSPEACLHILGIESNLSCKMDVFALGLLFFQYLTGSLPQFDTAEYTNAYEAVLSDQALDLQALDHEDCRHLLEQMLSKSPADRPDMESVFSTLNKILLQLLSRTATPLAATEDTSCGFLFMRAGDL